MSTVVYSTAVREAQEGFSFSLNARHTLIAGDGDRIHRHTRGRMPDIDILQQGDVILTLCGISNGQKVTSSAMKSSTPSTYLNQYLRQNASGLGVSTVSDTYVDEDDAVKINLSPSSPYDRTNVHPKLHLASIQVTFIFRAGNKEDPAEHDIFAERAFLPFMTALRIVVEKFVSFHLARRYPLIFGPLREKFNAESRYYGGLTRSISAICERSTNDDFRDRVSTIVARLSHKLAKEAKFLGAAYAQHINVDDAEVSEVFQTVDAERLCDVDVISTSLSRVIKSHIRAPRFKGLDKEAVRPDKGGTPDIFELSDTNDEEAAVDQSSADPFSEICWDDAQIPSPPSTIYEDNTDMSDLDSSGFLGFGDDDESDAVDDWTRDAVPLDVLVLDDDTHLFDDEAERFSSPHWSPDSSQSDVLETPDNSQAIPLHAPYDDIMDELFTDELPLRCHLPGLSAALPPTTVNDDHMLHSDDELYLAFENVSEDGGRVPLSVHDSGGILDDLLSSEDPQPYRNTSTTSDSLRIHMHDIKPALNFRQALVANPGAPCSEGDADMLMYV